MYIYIYRYTYTPMAHTQQHAHTHTHIQQHIRNSYVEKALAIAKVFADIQYI